MAITSWVCLAWTMALVVHGHRLVSIPDLHGDYAGAIDILAAAGLIERGTLRWKGGNATLVQTGDIIDRGPDSKSVYELFFNLADQAEKEGGAVVNLMGNHELMHLQGDFRYHVDDSAYGGAAAKRAAWQTDGWVGKRVRSFPAAVLAGKVLFVHGGLELDTLSRAGGSIALLNERLRSAIDALDDGKARGANAFLFGQKGPFWSRYYTQARDGSANCASAAQVLQSLGARRMVVGHTIVDRVSSRCGGLVLLGDTALSKSYGGEQSYIEHKDNGRAIAVYPSLGIQAEFPAPMLEGSREL